MDGHAPAPEVARPVLPPIAQPVVEQFDLDGVRTFFAPCEGPTTAVLTFRVGQADEPVPVRGVTHMIEHLALYAVGQQHRDTNGSVTLTSTNFVVRGTGGDVSQFLRRLTDSLRALPAQRFEAEKRVLATEEARRSGGLGRALLVYRFGLRGYGAASVHELGLRHVDPPYVQSWADYWFTRRNAVLWIVGELPTDLSLSLGDGHYVPAPVPEPLPSQPTPAWFREGEGVVAFDTVIPRTMAGRVAFNLALRRVEDRLRHRDATTYTVSGHYEPWTADHTYAVITADALPEHSDDIVEGLLAALGELAVDGPRPGELDELLREAANDWSSPYALLGMVDSMATSWLQRREWSSLDELLGEMAAVTPDDVRQYVDLMRDNALLLVPGDAAVRDRRWQPVASFSESQVAGHALARTAAPNEHLAAHRLLVAPDGVSLLVDAGQAVTVRFAETAAVQRWTDGARTLHGYDGFRLLVHPDEWENGGWAVSVVDRGVPPDRIVEMGEPAGSVLLDAVREQAERR